MQNLKISFRLTTLIEQAKQLNAPIKAIADIGTDHGYLPFKMFEMGLVNNSVLCDINKGPLDNAIQTFDASPYMAQSVFRLGSGIEPLTPGEVDLVFIAGMGGGLIRDILSKDLQKSLSFPYLILQPMTEQSLLRTWLMLHGFEILWDHFMEESTKHYEILVIRPKQNTLNGYNTLEVPGNDFEFGTRVIPDQLSDYLAFLEFKAQKYNIIQKRIEDEANSEVSEKLSICRTKLATIEKIREAMRPIL